MARPTAWLRALKACCLYHTPPSKEHSSSSRLRAAGAGAGEEALELLELLLLELLLLELLLLSLAFALAHLASRKAFLRDTSGLDRELKGMPMMITVRASELAKSRPSLALPLHTAISSAPVVEVTGGEAGEAAAAAAAAAAEEEEA